MGTKRLTLAKGALVATALTMPVACSLAQAFTFNESTTNSKPKAIVAGTPTIDLVRLSQGSPSVPLRQGNVVVDSEIVYAGGAKLVRGRDYQIDYSAGVVYLMRSFKAGDTMSVSYRYDQNQATPTGVGTSLTSMKFDLMPSALKFSMGYGMTERQADGNVLTSNVYGLNNAFGLGKSKLSGLFYVGQRSRVDTSNGFAGQSAPGVTETGTSQFILQRLTTSLAGGTFEATYQDISKNFTNFQAVKEADYDVGYIDQITKEKGLTRMGLAMNDVKVGSAKVSQSYHEVSDGSGTVSWQQYALAQGGFSLSWKQQRVDKNFKRFGDIKEQNRAQLQKEAGIDRDWLSLGFNQKGISLAFDQSTISDSTGVGVFRENVKLEVGRLKFTSAEQRISSDFARFASLAEGEQAQWARERGLNRRSFAVDYKIYGDSGLPWHYSQNSVDSATGSFSSSDLAVGGKDWKFTQSTIVSDSSFSNLANLSAGELDGYVKKIAGMYPFTSVHIRPEEKNFLVKEAGLERTFRQFNWKPSKDTSVEANLLGMRGAQDSAEVKNFKVAAKNVSGYYRQQSVGTQFTELGKMLTFERAYLGDLLGLDRTDIDLNFALGNNRSLAFSSTSADLPSAGLERSIVSYADKGISLSLGHRNIDPGFATVGFVDSERDLLSSLIGFNETDFAIKWDVFKGLKLDSYLFSASSDSLKQTRSFRNTLINWALDKNTLVEYLSKYQVSNCPTDILYANSIEQLTISRDFGKYGKARYQKQSVEYDGTQANLPSLERQYASYEGKINPKTSIKTEQTRTSFDNGSNESINANTISTELTKKVGLSVTDVTTDRQGGGVDERKQNIGFWWDVADGLRFSYGYNAQDVGANSTAQELFNLAGKNGTAKLGDLNIQSAVYSNTTVNGASVQSASNVQLAMNRPLNLGLIKDVKLSFGYDASSKIDTWVKENRQFLFTGKLGSSTLGFEYKGQMAPTGNRAVDRTFAFATDKNGKGPVKGSLFYKVRSTPGADDLIIRNLTVAAVPVKGIELTHSNITNPETANGNALLGSVVQASRAERWRLDWKQNSDITFGASFEELFNDQARTSSRTAGVSMVLFAKSPSPITLFYGLEEAEQGGAYKSNQRYHMKFDQKAGPNQIFSMFIGNVSYQGSLSGGSGSDNWTIRLDYQLRF